MRLRSPHDREILRLALPALGTLAAEPLYVLVDTAIVGHLGSAQLAALGIAGVLLGGLFALFNFLAYGTTAQVARAAGAGERRAADRLGAQALWLSVAIGIALAGLTLALATPVVDAMGADGRTASFAVTYLRISAAGLPFAFIALGGQGYLRGLSALRLPLVLVVAGNLVNLILEVLFVYGFGWGIGGSAAGTVVAQVGMGAGFVWLVVRSAGGELRPRPRVAGQLLSVGRHIFVRTAALYSAFILSAAAAARFGTAALAAHQVVLQLWVFLALILDAIAIAGQVITGRELGAGQRDLAYSASARMIVLSTCVGAAFTVALVLLEGILPRVFTSDTAVLAQIASVWWIFALMQPLNGIAFSLDGILIGAGDGRFLSWSMLLAFACAAVVTLLALWFDWGLVGVWVAILVLICVRDLLLGVRFRRRRWLVTGWG